MNTNINMHDNAGSRGGHGIKSGVYGSLECSANGHLDSTITGSRTEIGPFLTHIVESYSPGGFHHVGF